MIPSQVETFLLWALGIGALLASALCSGVEIGSYCANRIRLDLRALREPPDRSARLLKGEIEHPARLVATILIGNNLAHYFCALATTALLERQAYSQTTVLVANIFVLTPLVLIFGESVPKELFRIRADRLTYLFARPLVALRVLVTATGILPLVSYLSRSVERLAGLETREESGKHADSRQRIAVLLKESASAGVLSEAQSTLVDRALAMREIGRAHV